MVFGLTQISLFVVLAHTDPTDLTEFFVGSFWLTQIPRISLNCIDDGKSHRIVWLESRGGFWAHTDPTDLTDFFVGGFWAHTDPTDLTELH